MNGAYCRSRRRIHRSNPGGVMASSCPVPELKQLPIDELRPDPANPVGSQTRSSSPNEEHQRGW